MRPGLLDEIAAHYRGLLGDRLVGLVLYGSYARGTARPESDLDLFLLAEGLPEDPFERLAALPKPPAEVANGALRDPPVSVRALTPVEFARGIASLDLDLAVDGRILLDRNGYTADRLAVVRRRIEEIGWYRDENLFWQWRTYPSRVDWALNWEGVRR